MMTLKQCLVASSAFVAALGLSACRRAPSPIPSAVPSAVTDQGHGDGSEVVRIAPDMAARLGLVTAVAGPDRLRERITLYGTISANPEAVREIHARFPGQVRQVRKALGDEVQRGELLAVIESDLSLENYSVTAPIAGVITARTANSGQKTGDAPLFVITNVDTVWAELSVFPRDRAAIRAGLPVELRAADGGAAADARIASVDLIGSTNQALTARVVLDNRARDWPPGLYVTAQVAVSEQPIAITVPRAAVQDLGGASVVFESRGSEYRPRVVRLGRHDAERVEIVDGLAAGTTVVAAGSYVVKAELEKAGAEHAH